MEDPLSGAAVSINLIGGNQVLKVEQLVNEEAYIKIPLVSSVSGSAITIGAVSGSSIKIRLSMIYDETTASPTEFHMGIIESTGSDETAILLDSSYETVVGQSKYKWIVLSGTYIFSGKDIYLYFKGSNLSTYYIDNILIKNE